MTGNTYENNKQNEPPERVEEELSRLWTAEIKAYFKAEGEFLRDYGKQAGYGDDYITQVLADHKRLEELVQAGGLDNVRHFSIMLAGHFRYKEEYLARNLDRIIDPPKK